jgi:hypothetical protein
MDIVALVVIGLLVVGTGIALIGRGCRRGSGSVEDPLTLPEPTFNIVALGNSGAGKTVLLASMFHALQALDERRPYVLNVPGDQEKRLANLLAQVIDPAQPWPAGTTRGETRAFEFDCAARIADRAPADWPIVLRVNYIDYAGEILTETDESIAEISSDLDHRIDRADALLLILDGQKVLRFLKGEPAGLAYIQAVIQPLVSRIVKARCPAHLVLTKWDAVRDFGEPEDASDNDRLSIVRSRLKSVKQLRGLVSERRLNRLIPVSAVGTHFARIDQSTGAAVKRPDAHLEPINVEVPFAALVPDLFNSVGNQVDAAAAEAFRNELREHMKMSPVVSASFVAELLTRPAGVAVRAAMSSIAGRDYGDGLLNLYFNWVGRPYRDRNEQVKAFKTESLHQLVMWEDARDSVLQHFQYVIKLFEDRLPASHLAGE